MTRMVLICILALMLSGCTSVHITEVEEVTPNDISVRLHLEEFKSQVRCFDWSNGSLIVNKDVTFFEVASGYPEEEQIAVGENRYSIRYPRMSNDYYRTRDQLSDIVSYTGTPKAICTIKTVGPFKIEVWDGGYHEVFSYELDPYSLECCSSDMQYVVEAEYLCTEGSCEIASAAIEDDEFIDLLLEILIEEVTRQQR